ncbi:hypothetical protein HPP92_015098 [Vanilla planifolia]|uniref:Uncharacterized protein n=1 Tax=Vanilla planifolia TaxID=51239 RepID=A0A835QV80_VANPL|nr:hypothetical protein HPP92_015098 [Vanilla planifolia]
MEAPNLSPQSLNCFIHCFSDAGQFHLNRTLCRVWFDSGHLYLNVPQHGKKTTISLVRFYANFLAMEQAKNEWITGRVITEAVIDLPRSYNDESNRSILMSAADAIGVRIRRVFDRPLFAASVYVQFQQNVQKVLVFELGSSVLCSSLLEIRPSDRNITVLASKTFYGCPLLKFFGEKLGLKIQEHGREFRVLHAECERVKNVLASGKPNGKVDVSFLPRRPGVEMLAPLVDLDMLTNLNLDWIRRNIRQCLLQAGETSFNVVEEVVLVGVFVGNPVVRTTLESLFPGRRLRNELDPGTFVRTFLRLSAATIYGNAMVVSMDHIDRMWPEI